MGAYGRRFQPGVLRLEGPGDEGRESTGGILLGSDAVQVFDPVVERFHMSEHHGG